jgi:hypothetical protein
MLSSESEFHCSKDTFVEFLNYEFDFLHHCHFKLIGSVERVHNQISWTIVSNYDCARELLTNL